MVEPKENGCICQECAELGYECTNVAELGNEECDMCEIGIHGAANKKLTNQLKLKGITDASLERLREIQKHR